MSTLNDVFKLVTKYKLNGNFQTNKKTKLSDIFRATIPKDLRNYGVYIFTEKNALNGDETIVYIGKNGTINKSGKFGIHTLNNRIMQGNKKASWLSLNDYKVYWFITIKKNDSISACNIPSVVECELLKKYFDIEHKLPKYNNAF